MHDRCNRNARAATANGGPAIYGTPATQIRTIVRWCTDASRRQPS